MTFDVIVAQWSEGKPITFKGIEADTAEAARARVVALVNRMAGYEYCINLPIGTQVWAEGDERE